MSPRKSKHLEKRSASPMITPRKRGRPRKKDCVSLNGPNVFCVSLNSGGVKKGERPPKYQSGGDTRNGFKKKRGRPRKTSLDDEDLSLYDYRRKLNTFQSGHQFHLFDKEGGKEKVNFLLGFMPTEHEHLSEYELLRKQRRDEMLSMLRERFSLSVTFKSPERSLPITPIRPKKYLKRPLPPRRPRSLRLQGLSPGQRPLRRSLNPRRCHSCCLDSNSSSDDSSRSVGERRSS